MQDAGQVARVPAVQRDGPRDKGRAVGGGDGRGTACPRPGEADLAEGVEDGGPGRGRDGGVELPGAGGVRQGGEADVQQRVAGRPPHGQAGLDARVAEGRQGLARIKVPAEHAVQLIQGGPGGAPAAEFLVCQAILAEHLPQGHHMGSQSRGQVERRGEQRLQDLLAQRRRLVLASGADPGDVGGSPALPGGEVAGVPVGGEQLAVAGQLDDHGGGHAQRCVVEGADDGAGGVLAAAAFDQVAVAVVLGDLPQRCDLLPGQPVHPAGRLDQPLPAGPQGQRDPVGAGQHRDERVGGRQPGVDVLLGDQPPARIGDGGEVEPGVTHLQVGGQAGDVAEVPHVLVETDGAPAGYQGQGGGGAHIRSGERGPGVCSAVVAGCGAGWGHEVLSSGRSGRAWSSSLTVAAAAASSGAG